MKRIATFLIWTTLGTAPLCAMPSQITFQGTLKQQGVPVNTTKNMQFSFVDNTGNPIPGTTLISIANVQVTNGLFAVQLPIDATIPWEQYTPFIRVYVEGQTLQPDQPLNANLYAVSAIPQGMIAMFAGPCPTGWTRFSALDNSFPMGGASYGTTGGSTTHSHTLLEDSNQSCGDAPSRVGVASSGGYLENFPWGSCNFGFNSTKDTTTNASNLPPYLTVVFCQKL
jgi:hypothetical protein